MIVAERKSTKNAAVYFPKKSLKVRSRAKKAGVTPAIVDKLVGAARKAPATAIPILGVARLMARGEFRRAERLIRNTRIATVKRTEKVIVRGLKLYHPRVYAENYAA